MVLNENTSVTPALCLFCIVSYRVVSYRTAWYAVLFHCPALRLHCVPLRVLFAWLCSRAVAVANPGGGETPGNGTEAAPPRRGANRTEPGRTESDRTGGVFVCGCCLPPILLLPGGHNGRRCCGSCRGQRCGRCCGRRDLVVGQGRFLYTTASSAGTSSKHAAAADDDDVVLLVGRGVPRLCSCPSITTATAHCC